MVIYNHERERRVLERRLDLLDILDDIVRRGIRHGEPTEIDSAEVRHITKEFQEVLNLGDVCDNIKGIYGPVHFGPETDR